MGQLAGKTALVTGGSTGIGFATAARFAAEGAEVIITGRRQTELDAAVDELGEHVTGIRGDVSDLADLDRLYAAIEARGRGLDVLFANAGGGGFASLEELTPEQFDRTFSINVRGTVFTVQKALPLLHRGASVIVTGSTSAGRGVPAFGVYSASKAAVYQFARVWAAELAGRGIRVNTIVPGPTETPGLLGLVSPGEAQGLLDAEAARLPLGRPGRPEEIANGALFLASDQSSFMTGSQLFIDGGDVQTYAA
ncbi:SDR family NAD(P)-dependent oxidoreductase [Actinomycetospora sp. CA-053990]|uniref:SDR family NAD(P)-dependent oxidoreductase n=1 Tax=Actinomycetospora sp. CA-053990 TaxID=3239891 RepID=UPI003D91333F